MSDEEFKNMTECHYHKRRRFFLFAPLIIVAVFAVAAVVMLLWNAILPSLFSGVGTLTYWHALGLLVLSKILFSGPRHRCYGRCKGKHMRAWKEKWDTMSEEERLKFKDEMKNRWHNRC